jgi:mRNA interferase MazF
MSPGDVVLIDLPTTGGGTKLRPALLLSLLPGPYQNLLVCGISSQLDQAQAGWDEVVSSSDPDFPTSRLRTPSIIRLSYLHAAESSEIAGAIGEIASERLHRLLSRLAKHLSP